MRMPADRCAECGGDHLETRKCDEPFAPHAGHDWSSRDGHGWCDDCKVDIHPRRDLRPRCTCRMCVGGEQEIDRQMLRYLFHREAAADTVTSAEAQDPASLGHHCNEAAKARLRIVELSAALGRKVPR